jgi:Na+-driven multidrug efflux pump
MPPPAERLHLLPSGIVEDEAHHRHQLIRRYGTMEEPVPGSPTQTAFVADVVEPDMTPMVAIRRIARFSACGIGGSLCFSASTAITLSMVGRELGSYATVVYGVAQCIGVLVWIAPLMGICHAMGVRTSRFMARDPSGQRAAIMVLRGLLFSVPVTLVMSLLAAWSAPLVVPYVWAPEAQDTAAAALSHKHGDIHLVPRARQFAHEVTGMTPAEQVGYALWYSIPSNMIAALAWTVEFGTLFEPDIAMKSNIAALLLTYVAALYLVPLGLWAAQLVSCATFAGILVSEVALMTWRLPEWGRVLFSLGAKRRDGLTPVFDRGHLTSFAHFAWKSVLTQIGAISTSELVTIVVGPRLTHPDFAALNIMSTLMFMMWSVDEGFVEGISTVLSLGVGARSTAAPIMVLKVGGVAVMMTAITVAVVPAIFSREIAWWFTRETDVAACFVRACVPMAISRSLDSLVQVWLVAVKNVEHAGIAAVSTIGTMVGLVFGALWAVRAFGPHVQIIFWVWAVVIGVQAAAAVVSAFVVDWRGEFERVATIAPTESDASSVASDEDEMYSAARGDSRSDHL